MPRAYFNRGVAYWNRGDWDEAIADYTAAIRSTRNIPRRIAAAPVIYDIKGDFDKETANYTRGRPTRSKERYDVFRPGYHLPAERRVRQSHC